MSPIVRSPPESPEVTHRHKNVTHRSARAPFRLPRSGGSPTTATTIGSAGIILRSSAACSVTRYLPRTGGFMHDFAVRSPLVRPRRTLRAWIRVNEDPGQKPGARRGDSAHSLHGRP